MIANVAMVPQSVLDMWDPVIYAADLYDVARENTIRKNLCGGKYAGEIKGYGSKLVIRKTPKVKTEKFVANAPFVPQHLKADHIEVTVGRGRTYAVAISSWEEMTSDIKGWQNIATTEGGKQLDEDEEIEFFDSLSVFGAPENQGLGAGKNTGMYCLGTPAHPVLVTRADQDFTADANPLSDGHVAGTQGAALLLCNIDAMMSEQPGFGQDRPYVVVPPAFANLVRKSEHFSKITYPDTDGWAIRKGLKAIGTIAGLEIFQTNFVKRFQQANGTRRVFDIVFGERRALTYADIISRVDVKDNPFVVGLTNIVATHVYDWFEVRPEYFGHAYVTFDA